MIILQKESQSRRDSTLRLPMVLASLFWRQMDNYRMTERIEMYKDSYLRSGNDHSLKAQNTLIIVSNSGTRPSVCVVNLENKRREESLLGKIMIH